MPHRLLIHIAFYYTSLSQISDNGVLLIVENINRTSHQNKKNLMHEKDTKIEWDNFLYCI